MKQPAIPGVTDAMGSKKCWTCKNTIPYKFGFCDSCWDELTPEAQRAYKRANELPQPQSGRACEALVIAFKTGEEFDDSLIA